jgi:hypothetical protein
MVAQCVRLMTHFCFCSWHGCWRSLVKWLVRCRCESCALHPPHCLRTPSVELYGQPACTIPPLHLRSVARLKVPEPRHGRPHIQSCSEYACWLPSNRFVRCLAAHNSVAMHEVLLHFCNPHACASCYYPLPFCSGNGSASCLSASLLLMVCIQHEGCFCR